jgi:hypothetical protein
VGKRNRAAVHLKNKRRRRESWIRKDWIRTKRISRHTESIALPESHRLRVIMEANFEAAVVFPFRSVEALQDDDKPMPTCLALFGQLEASLHGSRKALLARDLAGIDQGTREQRALAGKIEAVLRKGIVSSAGGLQEELRQSGKRVLAAGRLQAALLARARRQLRVMVNMLADPSVNYGPMPERDHARAPLCVFKVVSKL